MQIDIRGKINEKKLAYNNALLPLYEAIVNSIQAIEENVDNSSGIIEINVIRSNQGNLNFDSNNSFLPEITDFYIKDNGIGFNTKNYNSFNLAHSTYKFQKGGKGIGRFTWLKAFKRAEIESNFVEDNKWYHRKFNFELTQSGIENHTCNNSDSLQKYTLVKLVDLKDEYKKWCNSKSEEIALKIIEHCFIYFLNKNCPIIKLYDFGAEIIVNDLFHLFTEGQVKNKEIKIRENKFNLNIVRIYNTKIDNKIHYCANTREVITEKLSIEIPELDDFLKDEQEKKFSIAVYVEGDFLDKNVNDERTSITFTKGDIDFPDQTSQEELRLKIAEILNQEFFESIEVLSQVRVAKVKEFVSQHPRYKQLLKYRPNELKRVPSTLSEDKMELELFKIQQSLDLEVKKEATNALKFIESEIDKEEFSEKHKELYSKIIEVGNAKLSEYVIHRKLVLDLLDKFLKINATEKAVHNLIFPLQTLSDEIGFEDHNLWMIDEKLSYHKYLASDKKFKKIEPIDSESNERPDIIVFNRPFAFANDDKPYQSIVLIEFKRPKRDDYTDEENPITQVNRYAREIIEGQAKDKNDRGFNLRQNTPIYSYIICDLTPKLISYAKDGGFKLLPNGDGFFFFNDNYNMYVEIMSFDKILKDARERNRILFDKLNLV
ncbi:MAG: hypothetical protein MUF45_12710 [Spirosomaceae bacterium]|jgi:hypothetical protein|nr:hypothetical protein [Spirosomataceae bacterium]